MEYALPIMTGLSLAALTGFRAFLPPLILGLAYKLFPDMININESFAFLAQDPVLIALGIAAFFEFLGDKTPFVDNFLDILSVPAKIIFSAILTFALIPGAAHWFYLLIAVVFAESATLTVHAGKTGIRAASSVTTAGVTNPVIGFFEDLISLAGAIAAIALPWLALLLLVYIIYRSLKFLFGQKGGNTAEIAQTRPSLVWHNVSQWLSRWFFILYNRMEIHGYEKIPKNSQFVTVANHASLLDGFIIGGALLMPLYIMGKKEAFENPITGWYLRKVMCFPVDRSKVDASAIKTAMKVLNDGYNLGIFPEGTRNRTGKVSQFKPGAIKLALKKKIPIVPAYIGNSHLLTPPGTTLPRPAKLYVHFLDPIDTKAELEAGKDENDIVNMLYDRICAKGSEVMGYEVKDTDQTRPDAKTQEPKIKPQTA